MTRIAALTLGGALAACSLFPAAVRAGASRFIPWTAAATPDLALNDLAGRRHTLADYRGRVVLLNFWATWCEPCRAEMASMRSLQEQLAGRPFTVLLANYGEARARVSEFSQREAVTLPILLDPNRDAVRAWGVGLLPSSFLVGPDGRVRSKVIGEIDWAEPGVVGIVRALLP